MEAAQADYDFKLAVHNICKNVFETAQADYETAVNAILPLREAKAEYDQAVANRKAQEANVEKANKDILEKEALVASSKEAVEASEKANEVLAGVTIDGLMETPMIEEEYLYLNAYVDGYKKSLDEKAQATNDELASTDKVTASEMKYAEAKAYATETTADLVIAQDNYIKAMEAEKEENQNGSGEQDESQDGNNGGNQDDSDDDSKNDENNGQSDTDNSQDGSSTNGDNSKPAKTEKPDKEEINKAPKTADLSGIGMASFGLFGSATIAAMATMFKRKRRTDEE